jgi:integrase
MTVTNLQFGSSIAAALPTSSSNGEMARKTPTMVSEVLANLATTNRRKATLIGSAIAQLSNFLNTSADQIELRTIEGSRFEFRIFLQGRRFTPNTVRVYMSRLNLLLQHAEQLGWDALQNAPASWREIIGQAELKKCSEIVSYMVARHSRPEDVKPSDGQAWVLLKGQQRRSMDVLKRQETRFWRLLRDLDRIGVAPVGLIRAERYGIGLRDFPEALKRDVSALLKWKQAAFEPTRPRDGRHRPITAYQLQGTFERLYGFAVNVCQEPIETLDSLLTKDFVTRFVSWSINERYIKGGTVMRRLLDAIEDESLADSRARKSANFVDYAVLATVPDKIRSMTHIRSRWTEIEVARASMHALMIQWLLILPWRQRNLRECRIGGANPNLFKGAIPVYSEIKKPTWVTDAETANPQATFWQFRFSKDETKTGNPIHALLPKQLIPALEEYLELYRPLLVMGAGVENLFVDEAGTPMIVQQVTNLAKQLTLQYAGRPVNPHLFRDIVAYTWLDHHPHDYLTVSKMLWHSNINTTLKHYGSRFNESNGVAAMESWLSTQDFTTAKAA